MESTKRKLSLAIVATGALGTGFILAGMAYGMYYLFHHVLTCQAVSWYAVASIPLLVLIGAVGFFLGNYRSTAFLDGLDKGAGTVIDKAGEVGEVKVTNIQRIREQTTARVDYSQYLPEPRITHRQLEDGNEVISL